MPGAVSDTYKFLHQQTREERPIRWKSVYYPSRDEVNEEEDSEATESLLRSLIGYSQEEALLFSRPAAWADLRVRVRPPLGHDSLRIDSLTLTIRYDFVNKRDDQAELDIRAVSTDGSPLTPRILVDDPDGNHRSDGWGGFRRAYEAGDWVRLTAPVAYGAYEFQGWNYLAESLGTNRSVTVELPNPDWATLSELQAVYAVSSSDESFQRGDSNSDGNVDVSDPIATLNYLFSGAVRPTCEKSADVNDDGEVNISDAINTRSFLFSGGAPPAEPFRACGSDSTIDSLGCDAYRSCQS